MPTGLNLLRLEKSLSAAHLRLASTVIEHLNWQECIERYDHPDICRIFADYHIETTDIIATPSAAAKAQTPKRC